MYLLGIFTHTIIYIFYIGVGHGRTVFYIVFYIPLSHCIRSETDISMRVKQSVEIAMTFYRSMGKI